jgi:rubrerythrin
MSELISVSESIEFAVYIEQNGYKFYVEAIKKLNDSKVRELFQYLADEEFRHEATFKNLLKDAASFTPHESYPGEYNAYMKDFVKSHALGNKEALKSKLKSLETADDAVRMALEFEKDSIVFFTMVKKYVGSKGEKIVDKIIDEELTHIHRINKFYHELKHPKSID